MNKANEVVGKVIFVGESGSGKSTAMARLASQPFDENYKTTIGVEFQSIYKKVGSQTIKLQIWDTAGQERFRVLTRGYYRGTLVYSIFVDGTKDINQQKDDISKWREDILNNLSPQNQPAPLIVVVTKSDLATPNVESLHNWLLTLEAQDNLFYADICLISSKDSVENLNDSLFAQAELALKDQLNSRKAHSKAELQTFINKKHFPQEYSELLDEHHTVRGKIIALFEDYDSWGVFQWRHHREESRNLINHLNTLEVDPEEWTNALTNKYQQMLQDPNFNQDGVFAERLLLAIKLIEEFQHLSVHRPGM